MTPQAPHVERKSLTQPHDTGWQRMPDGELRRRVRDDAGDRDFIAVATVCQDGDYYPWQLRCPLGEIAQQGVAHEELRACEDADVALNLAYREWRKTVGRLGATGGRS